MLFINDKPYCEDEDIKKLIAYGDIKYTIKSTSEDGVYYLVNGWEKCKTFWFNEKSVLSDTENAKRFFFKREQDAKASLTKLLKSVDFYQLDTFEIVKF